MDAERRVARVAREVKRERIAARRAAEGDLLGVTLDQHRGRSRLTWLVDPDPMLALVGLADVRRRLEEVEAQLVVFGRLAGYPWDDLAWTLGVTRQALQKRHPDVDRAVRAHLREARAAAS